MHSFRRVIRIAAVALGFLGGAAAEATDYRFVPGGANDWWMTSTNWDPEGVPNSVNDVAIFDASGLSAYSTNVHNLYFVVREMRFVTGSTWRIHNGRQDPTLQAPAGESALITQNGTGAVTFDTDLVFNSNTVFGGTGTGNITVNSSSNALYKETLRGPGGLTFNGNYTLALNLPVSYQGPTVINSGAVFFNGDTLAPVFDGSTVVGYTPATLAPVTVNSGGTLGGTGTLRAPVTVHAGGSFAPGAGGPGVFTINGDLALATGSTTLVELGGTSPGNGSGYHDQAIVTGQLSLGGTLHVSAHAVHAPSPGDTYSIFQYGLLDPSANTFDAISSPAPGVRANYRFIADYGSGANDAITLSVTALPHYYTRGHATDDWWHHPENWSHGVVPGANANEGDVVIFALTGQSSYSVNTHSGNPYTVKEIKFEGTSNWRFYNAHRDIGLHNPEAGGNALFTHDGSGTVTLDCDLVMGSNTIFGGNGSGTIAISGSPFHSTLGPAVGVTGSGGLTKNGNYALAVNTVANYQGETVINAGTLLFNGQSASVNPDWVAGEPDTYHNPVTMAPVTVNDGGTLGGTGTLRAPVTVHSGGNLAPGVSPGVFTIDHNLTLAAGSNTLIELGGLTSGNGSGHHDQVIVTGQLSLGGTLDVSLHGSHVSSPGDSYQIVQYASLDPAASRFAAMNDSIAGWPAHYNLLIDYGTGTNSHVTLSAAATYYYTGNHSTYDYWEYSANWDPQEQPGVQASRGDIVIFDESRSSRNVTNIWSRDRYVREVQFDTTGTWRLYHNHYALHLHNPDSGIASRFAQNNSGAIRLDCDTRLDTDTVFGGTGTGTVTIYGRAVESATHGLRYGLFGPGGLTKEGDYTLTLENYASYEGPTVINGGVLLFNAQSAKPNPDFDPGDTATWTWVPVTMAPVTVNDGGTLGGTGTLRAPVTVHSGGNLSPGASAGIFTVDSLTLDPGSRTLMELGGLMAGNGDGFHDQMVIADLLSLGGTLELSLLVDFEPTVGDRFVLFQYGSLDPTHNAFDSLSIPFAGEFVLNYGSGVNSQVILRAVPEPGPVALLLLGIGVLLMYRRRV